MAPSKRCCICGKFFGSAVDWELQDQPVSEHSEITFAKASLGQNGFRTAARAVPSVTPSGAASRELMLDFVHIGSCTPEGHLLSTLERRYLEESLLHVLNALSTYKPVRPPDMPPIEWRRQEKIYEIIRQDLSCSVRRKLGP